MGSECPLVSVVLLSYDRPDLLREVLDSIMGQSYENLEVIVVDNKSRSSGEIEKAVSNYKAVKLIRNRTNLGFAGGMNRGIMEAAGRYVYLTEDDIMVESNCVSRLVDYMQSHPRTGIVSGIIYNVNDGAIRCAGGDFVLGTIYRNKIFGAGEKDVGQFCRPFDVTFVPGAMVFSRLEFLKQLRGFRDDFFMYLEDVELCARVLKTGHRITVVPQAKVYHFESPGLPVPEEIEFHKLKNFFTLYLLHASFRVLPEFICRYGLLGLSRSAFSDRRKSLLILRAMWWVLVRTPFLLGQRYRGLGLNRELCPKS